MGSSREELEQKCEDGQIRYVVFLTHYRPDYSFLEDEILQCRIDKYHVAEDWWQEVGREKVTTSMGGGIGKLYNELTYREFNGELAKRVQQKFPFRAEHRIETIPKNCRYGGDGPSDPFVTHFRLDGIFLDDFVKQFSG